MFESVVTTPFCQPLRSLSAEWVQTEDRRLQDLLPHYPGRYLVQLGSNPLPSLATSPVPHKILVSHQINNRLGQSLVICSAYTELPLANESMDVVILPHILEFEHQPKTSLHEAWRVLDANAHLFILGFNPWSLLGLYRLFYRQNLSPWKAHFYSSQTIVQWIRALSGRISRIESFCFRPPLQHPYWLTKLRWMESLFPWILPYSGGIYLIVAQKRKRVLTPLPSPKRLWTPRRGATCIDPS